MNFELRALDFAAVGHWQLTLSGGKPPFPTLSYSFLNDVFKLLPSAHCSLLNDFLNALNQPLNFILRGIAGAAGANQSLVSKP